MENDKRCEKIRAGVEYLRGKQGGRLIQGHWQQEEG